MGHVIILAMTKGHIFMLETDSLFSFVVLFPDNIFIYVSC